jgi:dihydrofolate reductase
VKTRNNKKTWAFDEQEKRMKQILTAGKSDEIWKSPQTVECYRQYLKENISTPCHLTGIEDFLWEERYVFGYGDPEEYEELKKTRPSYTDTFTLIKIEDEPEEQIFVSAKRVSDKKVFRLELDWLEAVDQESHNYMLLHDYSVWFANF